MIQNRQSSNINLSQREKQVLDLIAHERTMKEIGHALFISHHTVVTHRKNLLNKLSAKNTAGLIRRSFELQILKIKTKKLYSTL